MSEKMILFNFKMPRDMFEDLDLAKRVTGLSKGMIIRAALEVYLQAKLKENEYMIKTMNRAFALQNKLTEKLNVSDNKQIAGYSNQEHEDVATMLTAKDSIYIVD